MKRKLAGLIFITALGFVNGGAAYSQVSIGVNIGAPPPPRVVRVRPRAPGAGYVWVDGYWYPVANRYRWHDGYWTRPPYQGATWMAPRYEGNRFFEGQWQGNNRQFAHDHRWDNDRRNRDYNRDNDRRDDRNRRDDHDRR